MKLRFSPKAFYSSVLQRSQTMQKLAKTGFAVAVVGALICAFPILRYAYVTQRPIDNAPFPLEAGSVFRKEFSVRTSESYHLELGCRAIEPLDYSLTDFLGSGRSRPRIECELIIQLIHQGTNIFSEARDELRPARFISGTGFWHLAHCKLPSSGHYTLIVSNASDLTFLTNTSPFVRLDVGGAFSKDATFYKFLGLIIGAPITALGIFLFLWGNSFQKKAVTTAREMIRSAIFSFHRFF